MDPRYATPEIAEVWSNRHRNHAERTLWVSVLVAQKDHGAEIPDQVIADYQQALEQLEGSSDIVEDLHIRELEREHGHDLYARLQYFNQHAGHDHAHRGLTSADITENVQQFQIMDSCEVLATHAVSLAHRVHRYADTLGHVPTVARTHGRPAQLTTVGKRGADWLDALLEAVKALETAGENYSPRGVKGAVGTRADLAYLLGSAHAAAGVDQQVTEDITAEIPALIAVGQCYPRGMDLPVLAAAMQLAAVCEKIAMDVRQMAMLGHVSEQPRRRQVGSSAMPHKLNPRYSERVCGLVATAWGYFHMLTRHQPWLEGDVSTSSTRRVALPGLFQAVDAALANTAHVLDSLTFHSQVIDADVDRWLPMLASGHLLTAALAHGDLTRDQAHTALREAADAAMLDAEPGPLFIHAVATHGELRLGVAETHAMLAQYRDSAVAAASAVVGELLSVVALPMDECPEWPGELL